MDNILDIKLRNLFNVTINSMPEHDNYCTVHINDNNYEIGQEHESKIEELFNGTRFFLVDEVNQFEIYLVTESLYNELLEFCEHNQMTECDIE